MSIANNPRSPSRSPSPGGEGLFLKNLKIGSKLTVGFGILVALTLIVIALSYLASNRATSTIQETDSVLMPTTLASSRAQANLLRMFAAVRGYLALGDPQFQENYNEVKQDFEGNLEELEQFAPHFDAVNRRRLDELQAAFEEWSELPEQLFDLRDDRMDREPAYELLNTTGSRLGATILLDINSMIELQADREPTRRNNTLMEDMANFQSSFASMFSGLRGYVTTRNRNFRSYEYETGLLLNEQAWEKLTEQREFLTTEQRTILGQIEQNREQFLEDVPEPVFAIMESDSWRKDLHLFNTELEPLTQEMQVLLDEMTKSQQTALQRELQSGTNSLNDARFQTLVGGVIAVILGLGLSFVFRQTIAGPVRRVTAVAEQIRAGDLMVSARIESGDEIGVFAETFNSMTAKLRETLFQIRKEKKRADDLLNVVIPIGVALSLEKDLNHLLERILREAMEFCHVDAGTLFLHENNSLRFVMIRITSENISMGSMGDTDIPFESLALYAPESGEPDLRHPAAYATLKGESLNIANVYSDHPDARCDMSGIKTIDAQLGYHTTSLLDIPLKNNQNQVLGVLELANAQDVETGEIIPFDANLQQMMESFSLLAVAALEAYIREQSLRQEIQQLRIEIDESKRQQQVSEIVDTDFFQDLRAKARNLRNRHHGQSAEPGSSGNTESGGGSER